MGGLPPPHTPRNSWGGFAPPHPSLMSAFGLRNVGLRPPWAPNGPGPMGPEWPRAQMSAFGLRGTGAPGNGGLWPVGLRPGPRAESQIVYFFFRFYSKIFRKILFRIQGLPKSRPGGLPKVQADSCASQAVDSKYLFSDLFYLESTGWEVILGSALDVSSVLFFQIPFQRIRKKYNRI